MTTLSRSFSRNAGRLWTGPWNRTPLQKGHAQPGPDPPADEARTILQRLSGTQPVSRKPRESEPFPIEHRLTLYAVRTRSACSRASGLRAVSGRQVDIQPEVL